MALPKQVNGLATEKDPVMAMALTIAFILFPIAELVVMVKIGGAIGILPLLLLLVVMAIAGGLLLRRQGLLALRSAMAQLQRNEAPQFFERLGCIVDTKVEHFVEPSFS